MNPCPVFYPTENEFKDLVGYIQRIEKDYLIAKSKEDEYCQSHLGICKIIPPIDWKPTESIDYNQLNFPISQPIKQVVVKEKAGCNLILEELKGKFTLESFRQKALEKELKCNVDELEGDGDVVEWKVNKYWKTLGQSTEFDYPLYGADIPDSLFERAAAMSSSTVTSAASESSSLQKQWTYDNALHDVLRLLNHKVSGVNTPMLYIGTWRSTFGVHVEDKDLYSINYLHYGEPKSWYAILPKDKLRFESFAEGAFPQEHKECHEYLRHKNKLFTAQEIRSSGLRYTTATQRPNEFMVTFPGAYHCGFNHGYNIAEATNFATQRWFDIGRKTNSCRCSGDNVHIDVDILEGLYYRRVYQQMLSSPFSTSSSKNIQTLSFTETYSAFCIDPERLETRPVALSSASSSETTNSSSSSAAGSKTGNDGSVVRRAIPRHSYRVRCYCKCKDGKYGQKHQTSGVSLGFLDSNKLHMKDILQCSQCLQLQHKHCFMYNRYEFVKDHPLMFGCGDATAGNSKDLDLFICGVCMEIDRIQIDAFYPREECFYSDHHYAVLPYQVISPGKTFPPQANETQLKRKSAKRKPHVRSKEVSVSAVSAPSVLTKRTHQNSDSMSRKKDLVDTEFENISEWKDILY